MLADLDFLIIKNGKKNIFRLLHPNVQKQSSTIALQYQVSKLNIYYSLLATCNLQTRNSQTC